MKQDKFTDIHHHILYGLDDGATNQKEMQNMLRLAAKNGVGRIVCTPHVVPGIRPFDRARLQERLAEAKAYCAGQDLDLELYEGAEILFTDQTCDFLQAGRAPTLAGSSSVLVEFRPDVSYSRLYRALDDLLHCGYQPIVAHVERYECLTQRTSRLERIKEDMDVCFQVNCSSLLPKARWSTRRFVNWLMSEDMLDVIASDAHRSNMRRVRMREAWEAVAEEFGENYANELTDGHLLFAEIWN